MADAAFTRLVDDHYAGLYRFALSLSRSSADASDLTQQTFLRWATHGATLRDQSKGKSWLFTTLYREFLRTRRRSGREQSLDETFEATGVEPAAEDSPDLELRLDGQTVIEALQDVEESFRAPLTLFYLQDLSYIEIAETLDLPIGTVMSRLSRGKIRLRTALSRRQDDRTVIPFPVPPSQNP